MKTQFELFMENWLFIIGMAGFFLVLCWIFIEGMGWEIKRKKKKEKTTCTAIKDHSRITLVITKQDKNYHAFADIVKAIERNGLHAWYGDIENEKGKEQTGIILTFYSEPSRYKGEPPKYNRL